MLLHCKLARDSKDLCICTLPTVHRFVLLMHDPQYCLAIAWQNVAYNQPPHPGFYLGAGMKRPVRVSITTPTRLVESAR